MISDLSATPSTPILSCRIPAFDPFIRGTEIQPPPFLDDGDLDTYAVDFETYYDKVCSVKTLGNYHYCRHAQFEAYMVSIYGPGVSYVGHPQFAPWHLIKGKGKRWLSHNAGFDEEVQLFLIETGVVPEDALPEEWHCTADMAAYFGAPRSLAGAMKWFHKKEISKTARNNMLGKRWSEIDEEQQLGMLAYAMDDSVFCRDHLWLHLAKNWPKHERKISLDTRAMGRRGLKLHQGRLHTGIDTMFKVREAARALIPWAPADPEDEKGILSHPKMRAYCNSVGIQAPLSLAKDAPELLEWEEKYGDEYPVARAMRDYRRSNTLLKKLQRMQSRLKPDGRMTFSLKYFGATITGRWSGDGGFNTQNQNKDPFYVREDYSLVASQKEIDALNKLRSKDEPLPGIVAAIDARELVIPDDGKEFIIADSSQIEPRCLNWLAGNWEFLKKIAEGFGIYEAFAVAKGRWPAEKKGRLKKEDPETYKWAKAAVLGLGYGCGKAKFVEVARILAGLIITAEESAEIVTDFRSTELHITGDGRDGRPLGLWRKLEAGMAGHIGKDFHVKLPSGRLLRYRDVQIEDGGGLSAEIVKLIHGTEKIVRLRYWGGLLTENLVQATAREVFASILLRLEAAGIPVVMHVHDEVVCEVDKLATEEERAEMKRKVDAIMSATPGFMKGLPLDCESQHAAHYLK